MLDYALSRFRRVGPRVPIYAFGNEYSGPVERHTIVTELSEFGIRLRRPDNGITHRRLQIEFELPELDEVVWADAELCHDVVETVAHGGAGLSGTVRTSGCRIVGIAESQRRLVREYVHYLRNEKSLSQDTAWCSYLPGVSSSRSP